MLGKTYYLETFGCQMNVLDSELVEGQLRALGYCPADSARRADLVLYNTCSVRQHAEDKVLSRLGSMGHVKRRRPDVIVGVIGCMAEREKEALFDKSPHVDLLCGPNELHRLPGLIEQVAARRGRLAALAGTGSRKRQAFERAFEADSLEALDLSRQVSPGEHSLQAYVRVQRGCDQFCTFCVVPFTRGPERSRSPGHIVEEVRRLASQGCREVTLLGQTVNSYVHQEDGRPVRFAALLERVHAVEGIDRIRFVTSFPADWDEDIFRVMRDYPKVCPYLHIPAQSGSDRMLKAMNRGYTVDSYKRLMDTARRYVPDIALASDFIVGFCGEIEADFQATVDLVRWVQYKNIFVFKYSPRPGTAADRLKDDDVPAEVKQHRNNELLAVQAEIAARRNQGLVGRRFAVLVEGHSKAAIRARNGEELPVESKIHARDRSRQLVGRTPQDQIAVFDGDPSLVGAIVDARVESASALTLFCDDVRVISPPRSAKLAAGPALDGKSFSLPLLPAMQ
ncbi:MAG: tRNA (N6-isopentenyl adenosine(37)-C2)-methylthiotransferase MiaB [Phycisphaerales bacterium]|nr:tRNA (N6-isopentenyl adenosine(37)-C2)-methylthiotransferase MiaB [Phycisphaerales bacterium]